MGNTPTKQREDSAHDAADQRQEHVPEPQFRPLSPEQRAVTFDERMHLRPQADSRHGAITLASTQPMSGFRPLQRAATFDPRLRARGHHGHGLLTVSDVMYRRYFNMRAKREPVDASRNLYRIPEGLDAAATEKEERLRDAVVVVDPFSTGMTLSQRVLERGYECICVHSDTLEVMKDLVKHIPAELMERYRAVIFHNGGQEDTAQALEDTTAALLRVQGVRILGVLAGAETGVMLADRLSERLGVTTNGSSGSDARRNKYLMGEKIRNAGLRAVKQRSVTKWSQIVDFIENELRPSPFQVIVKPVESAGSDDVSLCTSMEEVKRAFGNIQGKINGLGLENTATLVQEYLHGTEYVVDTVSRNGVHKVVAVWEYDKRSVNGAPFVYYGVLLRAAAGDVINSIVDYVLKVLDALDIVHGPGHAEVKFVDCTLDSYFDETAFSALPERPRELKAYGCEAMLVSYTSGVLDSYPGIQEIEKMPSYRTKMLHVHEGDELSVTIDMFTTPGSVLLVHDDADQLRKDYERVRELEHEGLYKLKEVAPVEKPDAKRVVVVVDPFSTGAVVAHSLIERGYECICVYSDRLENIENVASLVPEGTEDVVLCFSIEEAERTFKSILGKINGLGIENNAVLLQEYLEGDEYVVDTVSRNGIHKVVAVWKYDKRRVNDAAFVYFGLSIIPTGGVVDELIDYQFSVLDALGIRNGPAHGEVKFCRGSPVLIEVGARCHGGEGAWVPIANKCVGYNQVDAAIDSLLEPAAFEKLPTRPTQLLQYGCEAMLVSYKDGVLKALPGLTEIEQFPSFLKKEIFVGPGDMIRRTIDMFTTPGSIMLTHQDKDVLAANLARIRELEIDGLYELE
ncbi:hypothetical protein P43SY_004323 [Pythium insidiosum]|uniref:ATP-grasp domain-containing protein n=1 Tax=Pythium insidiosum TaxID=114742 RepID=A0AAD5Q4L6_PYTIN|nr:hypothetical protein P43SY_004323 [Pythium insidiosum]